MEIKWTDKQQRIVDFSGGNLLVAAGAGSGKTAVLTAHIVRKITNMDEPVDLDQLLVVTFTNAAAAEMKERVRQNLEQRLTEEPDNVHIIRQIGLIPSADISTIHSFCLKIIREQFFRLDIDPNFRLGDTGELALMKADILEEILEEQYAGQVQSFLEFRDMYGRGVKDDQVMDLILKLYEYSRSYPFPEKCLEASLSQDNGWTKGLFEMMRQQTSELSEQLCEAVDISVREHFPSRLVSLLREEAGVLAAAEKKENLADLCQTLSGITFGRKPALNKDEKKEAAGITDSLDRAFAIREQVKKSLKKLQELCPGCSRERLERECLEMAPMQQEMIRLVKLFSQRFDERKKMLGLCDFSDLEHMALQILYKDGVPTDTADTYARGYNEILIDEYQDCNLVQESILYAVSRERFGEENRFMVGDVKQSIYGFRQARPELFLEKYRSYSAEEGKSLQKIELSDNFRSRRGVLEGINMLFRRIMTESLGGISYDDGAALNPRANMPERSRDIPDIQVMLLSLNHEEGGVQEYGDDEEDDTPDTSGYNNREQEARMVAGRILELVNRENPFMVYDGEEKTMRPACFKDMVILMRSLSSNQESYVRVLKEMGIPVYVENETGYFNSLEVANVLDYLRLLDNPVQDIPLAAVMRSAFGGFSAQELADIRLSGEGKGISNTFYSCCMAVRGSSKKLDRFFFVLEQYRGLSRFLPIHELLLRILEETGYRYYVMALPQGKKRMANLDMLVARARAYEETSYRGLFHFIRYIDRMKTYDMDVDVPGGSLESVDEVRIMTIHKSKGLEFPIVFLSNLNGRFNRMDLNGQVLLDERYGIGADIKNAKYRYRTKTMKKAAMRWRQRNALLEEEMRVLYVGMTRAKELLVMTGGIKKMDRQLEKWASAAAKTEGALPVRVLGAAESYLDWIMPAVFSEEKRQKGLKEPRLLSERTSVLRTDQYTFALGKFSKNQTAVRPPVRQTPTVHEDGDLPSHLSMILNWTYPNEKLTGIHAAMSVSELKRLAYEEEAAAAVMRDSREEGNKEQSGRGAERGTAYHRVLELFDFAGYPGEKDWKEKRSYVYEQVRRMREAGLLSQEDADRVYVPDIAAFLESPLAQRMCIAAKGGSLHSEQPFLLGVSVKDILPEAERAQERILVRGIIDSYFAEENGLVLVDYKTDRVAKENGEEKLISRYKTQLTYYKQALEEAMQLPVKETYLYSFALGREIKVSL